ncbi:MAG: hypothetical protein A2Y30_08715 [Spirochaetes bacterium GWE1_32_154]|nr:MAG: hypothetical protein A2Y30_08715 [Spirochaetes bacterium GWE1_32_154]
MKRILLFVHYNPVDELADHVLYTLEKLKPYFIKVVFISNSLLNKKQKEKLNVHTDIIIERENKGYDFGAWKDGISNIGWGNLFDYDSMILMNDTCFGPLYDMKDSFDKMEKTGIDFWGINNREPTSTGMPGSNGPIKEHIRSFFFAFSNKVIISKVFEQFWNDVIYAEDLNFVIQNYETKLTDILVKSGFNYNVLFDYVVDVINNINKFPDLLIKKGIPFVKIKCFTEYFLDPKYLLELIRIYTKYPIEIINDFFTKTFNPNISLRLLNKILPLNNLDDLSGVKIAFHIHVFYIDVLEVFLCKIIELNYNYKLFFTVVNENMAEQIYEIIKKYQISNRLGEVFILTNKGRDIYPWLYISSHLSKYDVVGHFHTKKSPHHFTFKGESWLIEFIDTFITTSFSILKNFKTNKNIGIIIPDVPTYFKFISTYDVMNQTNKNICNELWNKMKTHSKMKSIDFNTINTPIMSYGNMFWYRPDALKPLFDLNLNENDFQPEPLPADGTLAHGIERLPVYIAWSQGYDYRIALNSNRLTSGFDYRNNGLSPEVIYKNNELEKQIISYNHILSKYEGSFIFKIYSVKNKSFIFGKKVYSNFKSVIKSFFDRNNYKVLYNYNLSEKRTDIIFNNQIADILFSKNGLTFNSIGRDPNFVFKDFNLPEGKKIIKIILCIEKESILQVFYKISKRQKFTEVNSIKKTLKKGSNVIYLTLPNFEINGLRIDPGMIEGKYEIKRIFIVK